MAGKKELSGKAAIAALGRDIDRVAQQYGMSGEELKKKFEQTGTLRVNPDVLLFYADELPASIGDGTISTNPETVTEIPNAYTFSLNSQAGAQGTIYLNFVGGTIQTPYWNGGNPLTLAAYSHDADPAFSDAELQNIKMVWRGVAEDYAPFNVNVTTEKPVVYNTAQYTEIYITPSSQWYGQSGGVAYLGSYKWGLNVPAFVFSTLLGNRAKEVTEAASHEAGHTVNLNHANRFDAACNYVYEYDPGFGTTPGWAPIMGNSYAKEVTQFIDSREWPNIGSGGCNTKPDQLTIMTGSGFLTYKTDDAANSSGQAQALVRVVEGGVASVDHLGFLTRNDTDIYRVDAQAGPLSISVSPISPLLGGSKYIRGNADFRVRLLSGNTVVAESNPPAVGVATVSATVATGTYYIEIVPTGYTTISQTEGGYPATGSIGQYNIRGTYTVDGNVDSTAPTVSMTAPVNGTTVSNTITVSADAADATGVVRVEFYRDNLFIGSDITAPYSVSFDTKSTGNGAVTFSAKAYDAANNIGNATPVTVTINNTTPSDTTAPLVSISSPQYGTVISARTTSITVKAAASDNSGTVSKMEVYINNVLVLTKTNVTSVSYKWNVRGIATGDHTVTVRAYDPTGNIGVASVVVKK